MRQHQQAGQHLHGRCLAAAVRADEAENLAAFDGEAHLIDGREIAEPPRQLARRDHRHAIDDAPLGHGRPITAVPGRFGLQERNEGIFDRPRTHLRLQGRRRAGRQDLSVVHGKEPIETLGLFHAGGGHDDARAGAAQPDAVDQFPELPARQRIDAARGLIEDQ
jgi:hypothetical protein